MQILFMVISNHNLSSRVKLNRYRSDSSSHMLLVTLSDKPKKKHKINFIDIHTNTAKPTQHENKSFDYVLALFTITLRQWLFVINTILPLEAILPSGICDWSILMMY